jgi:hypothetical protein
MALVWLELVELVDELQVLVQLELGHLALG